MHTTHARWIAAIVLLAVTAAVYFPGLGGRFLFDDYPNIVSNPRVHMETLDLESLRAALSAYEPGEIGRPIATLSFALDHLVAGKNPLMYKVTSLAVHLVNAGLVFLLTVRILGLAWPTRRTTAAAFAVAVAWAAHPIQVSSVLYVVQRMETLSTTFVLAALLAYIRGRVAQTQGQPGGAWLLTSALLAGIGLLSKETAALFPAYALALELTLLRFSATADATSRALKVTYAVMVAAAVALYFFVALPYFSTPENYQLRDFSAWERLLTQFRILPLYVSWILLPSPDSLVFYYDHLQPSRGLTTPWTTAAGAAALVTAITFAIKWRKSAPLSAFGILFFFCSHLITSNVIPLELAFEHRNYLALLGVLLTLADGISRIPTRDGPAVVRAAIGVILIGLAALTAIRSATWGNPFLLATDLAQRNPFSARASNDLGEQYMILAGGDSNSPFYSMAREEFTRGSTLPGSSILPEQALILLAATAGQAADQSTWRSLIHKLESQPVQPQSQSGVIALVRQRQQGVAMDDQNLAAAYGILSVKTKLSPSILAQLADHAINFAHNQTLANELLKKAVRAGANDPEYVHRLERIMATDGHMEQADLIRREALLNGIDLGVTAAQPRSVGNSPEDKK